MIGTYIYTVTDVFNNNCLTVDFHNLIYRRPNSIYNGNTFPEN